MNEIKTYLQSSKALIAKFYTTYYLEEDEVIDKDTWNYNIHIIGEEKHGPGIIGINDQYWNMGDIYTALKFKIPENVLFDWYDKTLDKEIESNLYHYFLQAYEQNG